MAQSVARSKFPQVYYARIPDPDCEKPILKCRQTLVPVDSLKTQEALWKFDKNRDNILGAEDLLSDPTMEIPQNAAKKLADIVIATQHASGNQNYFSSPESLLSWARARISVDRAFDTILWLSSFRAGNVYTSAEWSQIESHLGVSAKGYTDQVVAAARTFAKAVSAPEHKKRVTHGVGGVGETSHLNGISYLIDQRSFSQSLRVYMDETIAKMAAIFEFDRTGGIKRSNSFWSQTGRAAGLFRTDPNIRGLMIVVRIDDTFNHTPNFKYFTTQYFEENTEDYAKKYSRTYLCKTELPSTFCE